MFGFKKKKNSFSSKQEHAQLNIEQRSQLEKQIQEIQIKLKNTVKDEQPALYDQLGEIYTKLDKVTAAITAFETSLQIKEQFGAAYNGLLNLYEQKRKAAALAGNDQEIQKWVKKTDELLNMSKRVMRKSLS